MNSSSNDKSSRMDDPKPPVVVSNPQSGDIAPLVAGKPPEVIDLLNDSSSDEGEPSPKRIKREPPAAFPPTHSCLGGLSADDPVLLDDDDDQDLKQAVPESLKSNPSVSAMKGSPKQAANLRLSLGSSTNDPICFLGSDSEDEPSSKQRQSRSFAASLSRVPPRAPTHPPLTSLMNPIYLSSSSSDEDDVPVLLRSKITSSRFTVPGQRLTGRDSSSVSDDSSDDENLDFLADLPFLPEDSKPTSGDAKPRKRSARKTAAGSKLTPRNKIPIDVDVTDGYSADESSDDFLQSSCPRKKATTIANSNETKPAASESEASPVPVSTTASKATGVTASGDDDDDDDTSWKSCRSILSVGPQFLSSVPPKLPPQSSDPPEATKWSNSAQAAGSPKSHLSLAHQAPISRKGVAGGAHLSSIFASALKDKSSLDVRDINSETKIQKQQATETASMAKEKVAPAGLRAADDEAVLEKERALAEAKRNFLKNQIEVVRKYQLSMEPDHVELDKPFEGTSPSEDVAADEEDKFFKGGVDPTGGPDLSNEVSASMHMIPHLSSTVIDKNTGFPVTRFSVFGFPGHIIYDFQLDVRTSSIPNAGRGVFLTFVRARELPPSKKRRHSEIEAERPIKQPKLADPLNAAHPDGFGVAVTLQGCHLHCPYNSLYLLPTLKAAAGKTKEVKVRFKKYDLPYYPDELEALHNPKGKVGVLNLFTESDYVDAPRRKFSSFYDNCGYIDIGRYGPFRKQDRKTERQFDFKSFIFSQEPSEWGFGVEEFYCGENQMIDITDDLTGEPHAIAQQNIPMYVNEIGHDKTRKHTIHSFEKDNRTVEYFLKVGKPLTQGQTIEVFVDYFDKYESVRERKGYGLENLKGTEKSDDDFKSCLRRNFSDRQNMEEIISELKAMELYMLVDWLEPIADGLLGLLDEPMKSAAENPHTTPAKFPSALQLIACRRLGWLAHLMKKRLEVLAAEGRSIVGDGIFVESHNVIKRMSATNWSAVHGLLQKFPNLTGNSPDNMISSLRKEITEELCYKMKSKLLRPLDESLWCEVASDLTLNICDYIVGKGLFYDGLSTRESVESELHHHLLSQSARSTSDALSTSTESNARLAFSSRLNGDSRRYSKHNPHAKVVATMSNSGSTANVLTDVLSGDVSTSPLGSAGKQVHRTWYIVWQVLYIIEAFASEFLSDSSLILNQICLRHGLDVGLVLEGIKKGIECSRKDYRRVSRSSGKAQSKTSSSLKKKPKKKSSGAGGPTFNGVLFWGIVWDCLNKDMGWDLQRGHRQNDFYFCPPGVTRGRGFKNRRDFFDSVKLVMMHLMTDQKWTNCPQVKNCLKEYKNCESLLKELRSSRSLPKFSEKLQMVTWLRKEVKSRASS